MKLLIFQNVIDHINKSISDKKKFRTLTLANNYNKDKEIEKLKHENEKIMKLLDESDCIISNIDKRISQKNVNYNKFDYLDNKIAESQVVIESDDINFYNKRHPLEQIKHTENYILELFKEYIMEYKIESKNLKNENLLLRNQNEIKNRTSRNSNKVKYN
ncbi:viral A-type inclusion protein [Reticulomyxa filosa]|uniref:Viral A-type inclusion protein n=1 Tax=Reticulomyxa filosa TaxID=46433 RepID=X6P3H2_RETFI|nr:viral A-type inclusion protein [Reticulomyxa filosa]|eukprot:ETO32117.1 viral A-type inclusion protein [Reticulomyxa filosa]